MKRYLVITIALLFVVNSFASISVFYTPDVRWHWRPAHGDVESYRLDILYSDKDEWEIYQDDIPTDSTIDADGSEWIEFTVTVDRSVGYQLRAIAQNGDKSIQRKSMVGPEVFIDLTVDTPSLIDTPDEIREDQ